MTHTSPQKTRDGYAMRFEAPNGVVWALARNIDDDGVADLEVFEQDGALAAAASKMTDEQFRASPYANFARNRFGLTAMRYLIRTVRSEMPVRLWRYERKTGAYPGRKRTRTN